MATETESAFVLHFYNQRGFGEAITIGTDVEELKARAQKEVNDGVPEDEWSTLEVTQQADRLMLTDGGEVEYFIEPFNQWRTREDETDELDGQAVPRYCLTWGRGYQAIEPKVVDISAFSEDTGYEQTDLYKIAMLTVGERMHTDDLNEHWIVRVQ